MKNKPILIVLGEPNSIFSELLFKVFKNKINKKINRPLLIIGSEKLLKAQMKALKYFLNIRKIKFSDNAKLNYLSTSSSPVTRDASVPPRYAPIDKGRASARTKDKDPTDMVKSLTGQ